MLCLWVANGQWGPFKVFSQGSVCRGLLNRLMWAPVSVIRLYSRIQGRSILFICGGVDESLPSVSMCVCCSLFSFKSPNWKTCLLFFMPQPVFSFIHLSFECLKWKDNMTRVFSFQLLQGSPVTQTHTQILSLSRIVSSRTKKKQRHVYYYYSLLYASCKCAINSTLNLKVQ